MIVIARITAKKGQEKAMEKAFLELMPLVEKEQGTLEYRLHRSLGDPRVFLFMESYADSAALAAHSSSPYLTDLFGKISPMLASEPEIILFEEIGRIKR